MRQLLKDRSHLSHQTLDTYVRSLRPFSTPDGYRTYLSGMFALYELFGDAMDCVSERVKLPQIKSGLQDCLLNDLGFKPDLALQLMPADSVESDWAAAYLLEGAAMGGRQMLSVVQKKAPELTYGCTYLCRLAANAETRWPVFSAALNSAQCDAEATAVAVQSHFDTALLVFRECACRFNQSQVHGHGYV